MICVSLRQTINYPSGSKEKEHVMFATFLLGIPLCPESMAHGLMCLTGPRERLVPQ